MGFKNKKDDNHKNKKDDNHKNKKSLKNNVFNIEDENIKSISYFQIFRYASGKEKFMIFIGILGSIIQGLNV